MSTFPPDATEPIVIKLCDNGTKAVIDKLMPGVTKNDIKWEIETHKITTGIKWEYIDEVVSSLSSSQVPMTNVLIAETLPPKLAIKIGENDEWLFDDKIKDFKDSLLRVKKLFDANISDAPCTDTGIFVIDDEVFLHLDPGTAHTNVCGMKDVDPVPHFDLFRCGSSVIVISSKNELQYVAKKTGYLVLNENHEFEIIDPINTSPDKLELFFWLLPVSFGKNTLINKVNRLFTTQSAPNNESAMPDISMNLTLPKLQNIFIRRGIPPNKGMDGSLTIMKDLRSPISPLVEKSNIDLKQFSKFCEINEGEIIAKRTVCIPSRPGVDVFGEIIPVNDVKDVVFNSGEGVSTTEKDGVITYTAKETGILYLSEFSVKVLPELVIDGDVSTSTGNINFKRNITVKGNIAGYKIDCGADLLVMGMVEDGAEISCKGTLTIHKGIFGTSSKTTVKGNAHIGFIQNSNLRVSGNLIVDDYVYQSNVFVGGNVLIRGKNFQHSDEKGCVIGGKLSSFKAMELHSAGSYAASTSLYCGMDPELYENLLKIQEVDTALKKQIIKLQQNIGFDPSAKNAMDYLRFCSDSKKADIKLKLQNLKQSIELEKQAKSSAEILLEKVYAADISNVNLIIHKQVIPKLLVCFKNLKKMITNCRPSLCCRVDNGEIVIETNESSLKSWYILDDEA